MKYGMVSNKAFFAFNYFCYLFLFCVGAAAAISLFGFKLYGKWVDLAAVFMFFGVVTCAIDERSAKYLGLVVAALAGVDFADFLYSDVKSFYLYNVAVIFVLTVGFIYSLYLASLSSFVARITSSGFYIVSLLLCFIALIVSSVYLSKESSLKDSILLLVVALGTPFYLNDFESHGENSLKTESLFCYLFSLTALMSIWRLYD